MSAGLPPPTSQGFVPAVGSIRKPRKKVSKAEKAEIKRVEKIQADIREAAARAGPSTSKGKGRAVSPEATGHLIVNSHDSPSPSPPRGLVIKLSNLRNKIQTSKDPSEVHSSSNAARLPPLPSIAQGRNDIAALDMLWSMLEHMMESTPNISTDPYVLNTILGWTTSLQVPILLLGTSRDYDVSDRLALVGERRHAISKKIEELRRPPPARAADPSPPPVSDPPPPRATRAKPPAKVAPKKASVKIIDPESEDNEGDDDYKEDSDTD